MPDQGGLAGANLARDHGKAGIVHDAKFEHRERHAVHAAPVNQIGIGQYGKRLLLEPAYYFGLLRRRWPYFLVPFIAVLLIGIAIMYLWPTTYLSEGKILVQSQQIPTELVRPTVTSAAQERIQVIEQRTMTRDNLVAIADKFQLFPVKRSLISVTELVALMRKQSKIAPLDVKLDFR